MLGRCRARIRDGERYLNVVPLQSADTTRPEVVMDGLSCLGRSQVVLGATLVSSLHQDGKARRKASTNSGSPHDARKGEEWMWSRNEL